jgi:hypothetical protein
VARRARRDKGFWTKGRIRGAVAVGLIVWIIIAYEIPLTTFDFRVGKVGDTTSGTYALHIPGIPPVKYSATIDYTVAGNFSVGVGNPIYMKATVYDVNRSDFGSLFEGIDLLFQKVQFGSGGTALLPYFHPAGPGVWTATGEVVFDHPINYTGPVLLPTTVPSNVSLTAVDNAIINQVKAYNYSFPQLQPQSYTNMLSSNESEIRYGLMGSGIILVLLIPVFDRIALPKKDEKDSDK